jgi:CubicO group peptidase (beta-lactamase class C family)
VFLAMTALALSSSAISSEASADALSPAEEHAVDATLRQWMAKTGAPSVSVAIVRGGAIAYVRAFGDARLGPRVPATPAARYSIASVTKQFTAAAVLRLAGEGKLSLSDNAAKYLPELARPDSFTIRDLLSHTSGYADFFLLGHAIDRNRFTDNANEFYSPSVLADQKAGLAQFGAPRGFILRSQSLEAGFTQRNWTILTDRANLIATETDASDGSIEEFTIAMAHN